MNPEDRFDIQVAIMEAISRREFTSDERRQLNRLIMESLPPVQQKCLYLSAQRMFMVGDHDYHELPEEQWPIYKNWTEENWRKEMDTAIVEAADELVSEEELRLIFLERDIQGVGDIGEGNSV